MPSLRTGSLKQPLLAALSTLAAIVALPAVARAQVTEEPNPAIFPDPAKFARGIYTEGEVGGVVFFGPVGSKVAPGFGLGFRAGYDLNRFVAVQLHGLGSTHQTTFPGMPQDDQILQLYQGTAELKATYRFGQVSMFLEGGIGAARLSTNLLATVNLTKWRTGLTAGGNLGVDYHSLSRHFSVGLRAGYFWLRDISGSQDLITVAYLRYTF